MEILDSSSRPVANDLVYGWMDVRDTLQGLPTLEKDCKEIQRSFKAIGKPAKESPWRPVDDSFSEFMDAITFAVHWGKYHFNDQSGDPGHRARTETGFALKAALKRVRNNGSKFADNAEKASMLGPIF